MAKVFATYLKNDTVVLEEWSSAKAFQETESWSDEKFIYIATTDDFKGKASFPLCPLYSEKLERVTEPNSKGFSIAHTDNEIKAHNLMFEARNRYLKIKP
nr:hypothetical protein [Moritella viscosa]SHO03604.1 Putative uncharacterized protein [Moritella viscosa]